MGTSYAFRSVMSRRLAAAGFAFTILAAPAARADHDDLDELWVGGWNTHNVLRIDAETGASLGNFISPGNGGLISAHHFSFGPGGNFYVASYGTSQVLRYDGKTGAFMGVFVAAGNGLINAHTAYWHDDGSLLVSSENGNRVNRYDGASGAFLGEFLAAGQGGLAGPEYIVEGADGFLYLATHNARVLKLNPGGGLAQIFVWDSPFLPGDQTGGLMWGHGLGFGADGNLYVASSQNSVVLRYNGQTGAFIDQFITPGLGGLAFPLGIAFGPDGQLYVASFNNSRIIKYNGQTGAFLETFAFLAPMGLSGPLHLQFMPGPNCREDLNCDGVVNVLDLVEMLLSFGPCDDAAAFCRADLDGDGVVGASDIVELILSFGTTG